ncbi:uncharacterized protein LOC135840295 [Planococcus citri]|uniref:uncharacterized protein LOC135840295 n=1 Tax=Planococcus citri TaxID=170843 RepID=UPI0031F88555
MKGIISQISSTTLILLLLYTSSSHSNQTLKDKEEASFFDLSEKEANKQTELKNKRELSKLQSTLINVLKPVPVVDTIRPEEKYGNKGDKFERIGRGVVSGVEAISNVISSALTFPMEAVKKLSRSATEALNNLGGKLVGLQ